MMSSGSDVPRCVCAEDNLTNHQVEGIYFCCLLEPMEVFTQGAFRAGTVCGYICPRTSQLLLFFFYKQQIVEH